MAKLKNDQSDISKLPKEILTYIISFCRYKIETNYLICMSDDDDDIEINKLNKCLLKVINGDKPFVISQFDYISDCIEYEIPVEKEHIIHVYVLYE
jgi:hypothetical protein